MNVAEIFGKEMKVENPTKAKNAYKMITTTPL